MEWVLAECLPHGISQPIEAYFKAAEEGFAAAQFVVGLAYLEGYGVEKK